MVHQQLLEYIIYYIILEYLFGIESIYTSNHWNIYYIISEYSIGIETIYTKKITGIYYVIWILIGIGSVYINNYGNILYNMCCNWYWINLYQQLLKYIILFEF